VPSEEHKQPSELYVFQTMISLWFFLFACVYAVSCCAYGQSVCLQKALDTFASETHSNQLVYWCTNHCGGIGDRMAGLSTVFYMALVLKRKFSIWMPMPVQINSVFTPNKYNWLTFQEPRCDHRVNALYPSRARLRLPEVTISSDMFANNATVCISANQIGIAEIVLANPSVFGAQPKSVNYAPYFGEAFRFLFVPTTNLKQSIEKLRNSAHLPPFACFACPSTSPPWFAIHFRTGLGTTWVDPVRDHLSAIADVVDCFKKSKSAMSWATAHNTVLIASDNFFAKETLAHAIENATVAQIPIVHTDRSSAKIDGHFEAWAEFALLMHATCLVTSRSGFSQFAAFASVRIVDKVQRCLIEHSQCDADLHKQFVEEEN
jgi:hypothetical protein